VLQVCYSNTRIHKYHLYIHKPTATQIPHSPHTHTNTPAQKRAKPTSRARNPRNSNIRPCVSTFFLCCKKKKRHCNTLQCTATHCNLYSNNQILCKCLFPVLQCVAVCCSVVQCLSPHTFFSLRYFPSALQVSCVV